jgi:hypothetical protein
VRDGEFSLLICRLDFYVRSVCFGHAIIIFEFCLDSFILWSALPMVITQVAAGIIISLNFVKLLMDANWHNNNKSGSFFIVVCTSMTEILNYFRAFRNINMRRNIYIF